jgi:putative two-component system response regulator
MADESNSNVEHETEKPRILIIEDHPSTLSMLAEVIRRGGYEPVQAPSGNEGLRQLRQGKVDLILLDLMLEDMDGWTVLKTIKMDEDLHPIPVLIVTARNKQQEKHGIDVHTGLFDGYLLKPFLVDELLEKISEILC